MRYTDQKKEEVEQKGFSLKVQHRDPKTGVIVFEDPYILRVIAAGDGGKTRLWERPKGSGNLWNKKGDPIGRWVSGKWDKEAKHIEFVAPLTNDQKLARELGSKDVQIAELQKELAAIKAESEAKKPVTKKEQGA